MKQVENPNTPNYWDEEFDKEWGYIQGNEIPVGMCEYRWDGLKFGMTGRRVGFRGKFLDVACGLGNFCRYIKAKSVYIDIYGLDFSPKAIGYAKELARKAGMKIQYVRKMLFSSIN